MPSWLGVGLLEERELPLAPGDYKVTPGDSWTVTLLKTGETIYSGIGPVEVLPGRIRGIPRPIECIGPTMIEEASAPHVGFWKV